MNGKFYPYLKTFVRPPVSLYSTILAFCFLLFFSVSVQAKTVVIGSGSGDLSVTSMSGYSAGDVLMITPGTYTSGGFMNVNGLTFMNNGGVVKFTGPLYVKNISDLTFNGTGSSDTYGFVFNGSGGFVVQGHIEQIRVYNADLLNCVHLFDATQTGLTYSGNSSTLAMLNTTIANVHMAHCNQLVIGSFNSVTAFQNVIDSIDIHNLKVDSSLDDDKIVSGNGIFRCNFYDWVVNNDAVYPNVDCGIINISGNGKFHHIYQNGGWGDLLRCFASSLGSTVQDVWVYNCIKLNTLKYGLADVELQPSDMTSSGPGTTGCNIHVLNNTSGNCKDYETGSGSWYTPVYLTPSLIAGYTVEVRNNIGFNMPLYNSGIVNFTSLPLTNASNNVYYATAAQAGLVNDVQCMLSSSSVLIDAGVTANGVTDDMSHISRPQGAAYDIGAREYNKGSTSTNQPPVANAGAKQTIVLPLSNVTLDGSASSDPDGTIASFLWSQTSGPSVAVITNTGAYSTSVTTLLQGTYVFQLKVTDNSGASSTATVTIVVNAATNQVPVANAGSNQTINLPTSTVNLDGSASQDADGTIASYAWSQVSGPSTATISKKTSSATGVTGLAQGTYVFALTVTDNSGAKDADSVTVIVNAAANQSPVANAGAAQAIMLPTSTATLDGSASSDPDGTIASYAWSQVSGPSTATISSKNNVAPKLSKLVAGQYIFQLIVTDNSGATATAQVKITVSPAANQPPVANAGSNQTITLPINTITLDGSNSTDPDGTIASYAWTKVSGPSSGTIASAGSASTAVNNLVQGTYLFKLTVTDNSGATDADSVTITVNAAPNKAPTANAGAAKSVTLPTNSVNLDGSASSDPDGTIASYAWSQVSGPSTATFNSKTSATPTVSKLVAGQYIFQLTVTDNSGATATAQVKITVSPAANQLPVANAGSNQTITLPINTVTLDGSNSADPDGTIASYAWTKISGPSGTIASAGSSTTAVNNLVQGTYVYKLTVTDNSGATDADSVTITVNAAPNQAPTANAGTAKSITLPTNSVSLNGSASSDPDGTIASYAWSQVSGPSTATISSKTSATPTASKLVAGQYIFQLTVTDNSGATATAQVKITVSPAANQAPTANAGSNQTITLPINTVTLDGSNSADPDGTIASYAWTKISGPSGTIASAGSSTTAVNNLVQGTYVYKLTITDNSGATDADSVTITVNAAPNQAPTANAGTAKNITLPTNSLALDGSKSSDPDGTIASYAWSQVSGPSTATFSSKTNAGPTVSKLVAGQYIFQLTVTDNSGATATAQVKITVSPAANQPPSANAGSNQTITLPTNTVSLDGSNSADPDGTIASYAWTKISGPSSGTIASAGSSTTAINNLVQGTYLYKLTVTDNSGATDADSVTITVNAAPNQAPTANAGTAKNITLPTNSMALDGSKSSDPDGTIASYAWSQVSGPSTATFSSKTNATPTASKMVAGQYIFQLTVTDNSGATATAQVKITVSPAANQPPSANAGSNQTITLPTNTVTLDGSNSSDPDGTIAGYAWTKISGPSVTIASAGSSTTAVNNLVQGTYLFKLVVTDNSGATNADSVTITVNAAPNQSPVANAGTSKTITLPVSSTSLDGTKSNDPDGTIAGYSWTQVSGPATATFAGRTSATPTVSNLVAGQYSFQLTVTDNNGATASSQVKITVSPAANVSPSANAGSNQTITLPTNSITLDGSGTQKGTGTITGYTWTKVSGPAGSALVSAGNVTTLVNNLVQGTYVFKLTVTDNNGISDADSVTITVNAAPNQAPTANAGTTKRITLPVNSVSLDGTKSSDPDGTITGDAWTQVAGPSTATVTGGSSATPTVSNLVAGQYTFQLTVTDNDGATANAQVKITVSPAANQAPTANAGSSQTITLPTSSVTLDGSASDDPDGTIASYSWSQVSGPATASIVNKNSATTDVNSLAQGTYIFQITVTDNSGATAADQVTVTVNAAVNIAPVANAGSGRRITLPVNSVNLDGSRSADADGTITGYAWIQVSGPSTATLANANTAAPVASNLKAGQYVFQLTVTDNDGATDNAQVKITVSAAANQAPSANAGSPVAITAPASTTTIDGSASSDPDGTIASYAWTQVSGPSSATITSNGTASTAVNGLVVGTYVFELTVTDNSGASATDQVTVTVIAAPNLAPNANAGNNRSVTLPVNSANLNGSRSSDVDGTIVSYAWIQVSGPSTATITNDNTVSPSVSGLKAGQYIFQLTVTDNDGATDNAQVKITVIAAANQSPNANAGSSVTITLPVNTVNLDGSASSDPDGTIASFAWSQASGPSTATIVSAGTSTTAVNGLVAGTYVFELAVTDNSGATATDQVTVTVIAAPNQAPNANAGNNRFITLPVNSANLSGSRSSDVDGTIVSYAWIQVSGPSTATITNDNTVSASVSGLKAGQYIFQLTVTDNDGATDNAQVKITVIAAANQAPNANAGSSVTITLPLNTVNLDGSASSDPDGTIAGYAWSQASGPSTATIVNAGNATTAVNGLVAGTYVFQLTVTDNSGATATDEVTITVNAAPNQDPNANAGNNMFITLPVNTANLNGSASSDPDGTIASYNWMQVSGPNVAALNNATTANPSAANLVVGQYIFQLTVTDNRGATDSAQVKITVVAAANQPPTANAGSNLTITLPVNSVTVNGGLSSDPDGTIASYAWTQFSGPSTAAIANGNNTNTAINGLVQGTYIFALTVTDNKGATGVDYVRITVRAAPNQAPVANAGATQTITLPVNTVTLNGTQSTDVDGTIASYTWSQVSGPSTAVLSAADSSITKASGLAEGEYTFALTVVDDDGANNTIQVKIIVVPAPNQSPNANAGADKTITLPTNTVALDGTKSFDPDGAIASYSWKLISGPGAITITNSNSATPTAIGLQQGTYVFELTVADSKGLTDNDQVTVVVNAVKNQAPVANAGPDKSISLPTNSVVLDGSLSKDPDGTIAGYSWAYVSGPGAATIVSPTGITTSVSGLNPGVYVFELTVTDNSGATGKDQVIVAVSAATVNTLPVANAGKDTSIAVPATEAVLDGSASSDVNGVLTSYQWTQVSGPTTATIGTPAGPVSSVTNLSPGVYVFQLTVRDNHGTTATATVKITVVNTLRSVEQLTIYPNPVSSVVNVRIISDTTGTVRVNIFDMSGRLVQVAQMEKPSSFVDNPINVSTLAGGMYTLQIRIGTKKTMIAKMVKQ